MKKISLLIVLFVFSFWNTFSYNLNEKDNKLLEKAYVSIDKINEKSPEKINLLNLKLKEILKNIDNNSRNYELLKNILLYIEEINSNNLLKIKVEKVIDWDTFSFYLNWKLVKTRMIWVDAPENSKTRYWYIENFWEEAKVFLKEKIEWKEVILEYDKNQWKFDKYWRHLIYVFIWDENINNSMILNWYAKEYTYNKKYKYYDLFKKSEKSAKENKKLIWKNENIENIIEIKKYSGKIKWNISYKNKEKIYHTPWCNSYNKTKINLSKWEKYFNTEKEAIDFGWRKAENCK